MKLICCQKTHRLKAITGALVLMAILSCLFLLSCKKSTEPEELYILIHNYTNGVANLTFHNAQHATIQPDAEYKWHYLHTGKDTVSNIVSFDYEGDYLMPGTKSFDTQNPMFSNTEHYPYLFFSTLDSDCARLELVNQTNAEVTATLHYIGLLNETINLPANQTRFIKLNMANNDSITVNYEGRYAFAKELNCGIRFDYTTNVQCAPDAGSLEVINSGGQTISGVYIADAGTTNYGSNLLTYSLGFGEYQIWKLQPRHCDIKITYSAGGETIHSAHDIILNQTQSIVENGK